MAIYEFSCEKCKKNFDVMQAMDDIHEAKCPDCKKKATRKFSLKHFKIWFKEGYQVGLGKYCNTQREANNEAARQGCHEVRD